MSKSLSCYDFEPENVFKRFKVIEFPISFVGLSTSQILDVEVNLETDAYIKTMCNGKLMEFEKAREVSAKHRAFIITRVDNRTLKITFKPINECLAKVKDLSDNRFIFDLRLIKVEGSRCCNDETHSEIGRYYISGLYETYNITHYPKVIDYGTVTLFDKVARYVRIRNESTTVGAKFRYMKVTNYDVIPAKFTIPPNSTKRIQVILKPTSAIFPKALPFTVRNSYDICDDDDRDDCQDDNFLPFSLYTEVKIMYNVKRRRDGVVESLHHIIEPSPRYTYLDDKLIEHKEKQEIAKQFLLQSKIPYTRPVVKISCKKEKCQSCATIIEKKNINANFCTIFPKRINTSCLLGVTLTPFTVNFGRIAVKTYGEQQILINNDTPFEITIDMLRHKFILYTEKKLGRYNIGLKPFSKMYMTVLCFGTLTGCFKGSFNYVIDQKYHKTHPYRLEVGNSLLMIQDASLKFGMVTTEAFVTSVPIRIYNHYNIDIDFEWGEISGDIPYKVIPTHGTVAQHSCKLCDVIHLCKSTKYKSYEIECTSKGQISKVIPVELVLITRKLTIKFLQTAVAFGEIPLNKPTIEEFKLENTSREFANYTVLDPQIPEITIEPMSGVLKPKMVKVFNIQAKIACLMEFAFDLQIKINNKEVLSIPVTGVVVEPKLVIHPKSVVMPRVPNDMIVYFPVTFQNVGTLRSDVEIMGMEENTCNNVFEIYTASGIDKIKIDSFFVDPGQSKTVFIKVYDTFRREYNMFIPFRINGVLGPIIDGQSCSGRSLEFSFYTSKHEEKYENNLKAQVKTSNKEIPNFRIEGVLTLPWLELSVKKFEIEYLPDGDNSIQFTMTNVSRYVLSIIIQTGKITPNFSLEVTFTEDNDVAVNDNSIKFQLNRLMTAQCCVKFHPKGHGRFVAVAVMFIDKSVSIPYSNLTFIGTRQVPHMTVNVNRIIFPPCHVGTKISQVITVQVAIPTDSDLFHCSTSDDPRLTVEFEDSEIIEENNKFHTVVQVKVTAFCQTPHSRHINLRFHHEAGSCCEVDAYYCFTYCPLTLHTRHLVTPENDPYPYYPLSTQTELYEYLEQCTTFLEQWMFQQGFRRDMYPDIPDTFHATAMMTSSSYVKKAKGMSVTFLNFMRRIAGPLMKYVQKVSLPEIDGPFKIVQEIHETYRQIIHLLRSRGANVLLLKAKFLLSYNQFVIYTENTTTRSNNDMLMIQELQSNAEMFNRLSKQSWIDFILQIYKVFVMDSCFFECMCLSSQPRDIIQVLVSWYNEHIRMKHSIFRENTQLIKIVDNLTTDLSDGIAIMSVFLVYCPFLQEHFSAFCEEDINDESGGAIISNACLIIEAMNQLRLFFPLTTQDFLKPNFLQMLFLSLHLFIILPTMKPKETINFNPPLLRSSSREIAINPTNSESLLYTFMILNNSTGCFAVEKSPGGEASKKTTFVTVTYKANFIRPESAYVLIHGYNKGRIFDTYVIFHLIAKAGALNPARKCKVTGPLYRSNKVDVAVCSPFPIPAIYEIFLTDVEPCIPVDFKIMGLHKRRFYVQRLNLMEKEIFLDAKPLKETSNDYMFDSKVHLEMVCLSTHVGTYWIWFRSDVGEFFVKVSAYARWDIPVESFQVKVKSWPMNPCTCGEDCECYRTSVVMIPHSNELMLKALRHALTEYASDKIMEIYDQLVVSTTGHIILLDLLTEGGTNISDVEHILRRKNTYRITSRFLTPQLELATLAQYTDEMLALPLTVPPRDTAERFTLTLTCETGPDIRTYRVFIIQSSDDDDDESYQCHQ